MNTSHYPSLELCKKLTEIGFPKTDKICEAYPEKYPKTPWNIWLNCYYSPSVMEMLDVMPTHELEIEDIWNWSVLHSSDNRMVWTLPNALAEMILWLHENNYITFTK